MSWLESVPSVLALDTIHVLRLWNIADRDSENARESVCVHIYTVLLLALFKSVQFFAKDIQPDKLLPTQIGRTPMHTKLYRHKALF